MSTEPGIPLPDQLLMIKLPPDTRKEVKAEQIRWSSKWPEYSPIDFTAPSVSAAVCIHLSFYDFYALQDILLMLA